MFNWNQQKDTTQKETAEKSSQIEGGGSSTDIFKDISVHEGINISKAPPEWNARAQQKWGELPPEVRKEVKVDERKKGEIYQKHSVLSKDTGWVNELGTQYPGLFGNKDVSIPDVVQKALAMVNTLTTGTHEAKSRLIADQIKDFNVDTLVLKDTLEDIASGKAPLSTSEHIDQNNVHDIVKKAVEEVLASKQPAADTKEYIYTPDEVNSFVQDPANEFAKELFPEMEAIVQGLQESGKDLSKVSLKQIYDHACANNSRVNQIINERKAMTENATLQTAPQPQQKILGDAAPAQTSAAQQPENVSDLTITQDPLGKLSANISKVFARRLAEQAN